MANDNGKWQETRKQGVNAIKNYDRDTKPTLSTP